MHGHVRRCTPLLGPPLYGGARPCTGVHGRVRGRALAPARRCTRVYARACTEVHAAARPCTPGRARPCTAMHAHARRGVGGGGWRGLEGGKGDVYGNTLGVLGCVPAHVRACTEVYGGVRPCTEVHAGARPGRCLKCPRIDFATLPPPSFPKASPLPLLLSPYPFSPFPTPPTSGSPRVEEPGVGENKSAGGRCLG